MAHIRLPDPKPGLKPGTASLEKYNDVESACERLLLVLTQLDALVRIAVQGDFKLIQFYRRRISITAPT